jgi:diacylglycerol kinase family enzyme
VDELAAAAGERGIQTHVLRPKDDAVAIARGADADALGVAGGDGSLAPIADVAIARALPFACVPFGTRNHFARDLGLDRNDPLGALEAFAGEERVIDVGRVDTRLFLNNVSFGAYASLVHRREHHRRRRDALAGMRALLRTTRHPHRLRLEVDGAVVGARVILVANNGYELSLFDLGARPSLDEGRLYLYTAGGLLPTAWEERAAEQFEFGGAGAIQGAVDGEPVTLRRPFTCRIEARALRALVPPGG